MDQYFYHWNVQFSQFCTKSRIWMIIVSKYRRDIVWILIISVTFIVSIKGNFFKGSRSSVARMFLPLKYSFLIVLYKKSTLSDCSFRGWAQQSLSFVYLNCLYADTGIYLLKVNNRNTHCGCEGKVVFKL